MAKRKPDPDAFKTWLEARARAARDYPLGNNRQLGRLASRFGITTESARHILKRAGWTVEPTPSGALNVWRPPKAEEGS